MKQLKHIGLPILSILIVCFYPCAFLFFQNAEEAHAADMLPFFGVFLLSAALIFLIFSCILRNVSRAAVMTDLSMLVVINFNMICTALKKLLPGFRDKILLIAVLVLLLLLLVLLLQKKPQLHILCGLIALAFGCMTFASGAAALPTLIATASYEKAPADESITSQVFSGDQRNVYYMIFDEFAGPESLMRYYDRDNEEFFSALEQRGFSVSRTSRNTESCWTVTLVPNMMNLSYVTDDTVPINSRLQWLENPALYQLFRNNGYDIHLVNHDDLLDDAGCKVLTRHQTQETISDYIYQNSIFCLIPGLKWEIEERVLHQGENSRVEALENAMDAMTDCWQHVDGPTLTACYLATPHAPFLFHADGTLTGSGEYYDWHQPELYLTKLQYTGEKILEAVDNIQKNDPEAVILLQADHGVRTPGHLVERFGGPWFDTTEEIPYMENVLCAVYTPGDKLDIEGDTCINAARKTLDRVFGTTLGTLPVPEDYTIPDEYMPPPPEDE